MEGRTKGSTYKMKGSPMARNFGVGGPLRDEKVIVVEKGEDKKIDDMTGSMNSTGTRIINEKGSWVDSSSVAGKQLRSKYSSTNYDKNKNTPSGDLANKPVTIVREQ